MDEATGGQVAFGIIAGISSLGFYLFLAAWVVSVIWSRTKEKLAVQETLRKLIDSGTALSPDVIDALRRPKPRRSPAEVRASAKRYLYWGTFLVVLGVVVTLWGLRFSESPVQDLRELPLTGVVFFVIPGLFCLAHSLITRWTAVGPQE
jgi:energy-converting hydrogenase Eha subunit E